MAFLWSSAPRLRALGRRTTFVVRWVALPVAFVGFGICLSIVEGLGDPRWFRAVLVAIVTIAILYHVRHMVEKRRFELEEHGAEARLAETEAHLRDVVERLPAAVYRDRYDRKDGRFVAVDYVSPQMAALTGYAPADFIADPQLWLRMIHRDDQPMLQQFDARELLDGEALKREYRLVRRDGHEIWVREEARMVRSPEPDTILSHGILTDITDRKLLERQLNRLAFHDQLTGLPNRLLFEDRLRHTLASRPQSTRTAVAFMDLDGFKNVNDSLGHATGDQVLQKVGERLTGALRPGDTVARLGGDEFGILITDIDDAVAAARTVDRVVEALRAPIEIADRRISCQGSLGIAMAGIHGSTPEELLRNADWAMYVAKVRRRGSWVLFDPTMHREAVERFDLASDLRRAVEAGELTVAYQPIVSLTSGGVVGAEALARWHHPTRGDIAPRTFIDLAEEIGLIGEIGRQVLLAACRQAAAWRRIGAADAAFRVHVNVSTRQLNEALPDLVAETLTDAGLPARNLGIEITESAVMHDPAAVAATLDTLRAMGVAVAMDDFGTGYSSLSHLATLPLDTVKIDGSFVAGIDGPLELAVIRSVIGLAAVRGLRTIAEGVETLEQADTLAGLGCHLAQGYFFGRPVAGDVFSFESPRASAAKPPRVPVYG